MKANIRVGIAGAGVVGYFYGLALWRVHRNASERIRYSRIYESFRLGFAVQANEMLVEMIYLAEGVRIVR